MKTVITENAQGSEVTRLQDEALIAKRDALKTIIRDAEALLKEVEDELKVRIERKDDGILHAGNRQARMISVRCYKDVPVEFADRLNATKIVVDTKVLGALHDNGTDIPQLTFTYRLDVK